MRVVVIEMLRRETAGDELQAAVVTEREGLIDADTGRAQIGVPGQWRQFERKRGLADEDPRVFTGSPAHPELIDIGVIALVVVVDPVEVVVVAALREFDRGAETQFGHRDELSAEPRAAAPAAHGPAGSQPSTWS